MASSTALRQPMTRVPLQYDVTRADELGVVGLKCRVKLWLEAGSGLPPVPFPFVVDSGASYSLIDLEVARDANLPVPPRDAEVDIPLLTTGGTVSMRVRPGRVRCRLGRDPRGYPFDWPVMFRVHTPRAMPSILGLGGVIHTCRWTFDGTPAPAAPYGSLALEDIR